MKFNKNLIIESLLLVLLVAFAGRAQKIPNGYREGRPDASEGIYHSVMSAGANDYQSRALALENQAYGLARIANQNPVKQSEKIYLLENRIVRLNLDIANAGADEMTPFERESLLALTTRTYDLTRRSAERIFEDMIRFIDIKIPGPSGRQNRTELSDEVSMYEANYRVDSELSQSERDARYAKGVAAFQNKGGNLREIRTLTPALLQSFRGYTRLEYVWLLDGRIQVTEGDAGHVLLAAGKPVKAAGQIIFLKGENGQFSMVVVSNSSGNYKPDLLSAKQMAVVLEKKFKVPSELVVLTKGEPMSTQAVKVYLKGEGIDPALIKKKISEIETKAVAIRSPRSFATTECSMAFN